MDTPATTETIRIKPVRRWPWVVLGVLLGLFSCGGILLVLAVIGYLKETRETVVLPTVRLDEFRRRRRPGVTQDDARESPPRPSEGLDS